MDKQGLLGEMERERVDKSGTTEAVFQYWMLWIDRTLLCSLLSASPPVQWCLKGPADAPLGNVLGERKRECVSIGAGSERRK